MTTDPAPLAAEPKTKNMLGKVGTFVLIAAVIGAGLYLGFREEGIDKANSLKDEGNAALTAGNKFEEMANTKYLELFDASARGGFPGNRAEHEAAAREVDELFGKAVEQFRLGAAKFDEASKQNINSTVSEYFSVWNRSLAKMAERRETSREFVKAWLNKEIDTREKLESRAAEMERRFTGLTAAINDLNAQATKIETEKASEFEK